MKKKLKMKHWAGKGDREHPWLLSPPPRWVCGTPTAQPVERQRDGRAGGRTEGWMDALRGGRPLSFPSFPSFPPLPSPPAGPGRARPLRSPLGAAPAPAPAPPPHLTGLAASSPARPVHPIPFHPVPSRPVPCRSRPWRARCRCCCWRSGSPPPPSPRTSRSCSTAGSAAGSTGKRGHGEPGSGNLFQALFPLCLAGPVPLAPRVFVRARRRRRAGAVWAPRDLPREPLLSVLFHPLVTFWSR